MFSGPLLARFATRSVVSPSSSSSSFPRPFAGRPARDDARRPTQSAWSTEFASCRNNPIAHNAFAPDPPPPPPVLAPLVHSFTTLAPSTYKAACVSAGLQNTTISVFAGRCAALIEASLLSTRFFVSKESSNAAFLASAISDAVAWGSPPRRTGCVNLLWNECCGPNKPGHANSITAAYSSRLFCTGVPVSKTRMGAFTVRSADKVCDSRCVFFNLCASSHTTISGRAPAATGANRRSVS
mmetsp:Transcript_8465/g.28301  ORF Transcript_8465/g.28301 Transcript_8465/m.28301 type:complete len:240 (-) Transcript_8465:607-1326(-)